MSAYYRLMTMFNTEGMPAPKRYRFAREAAGLKQEELALMLGVARTTVGEWESGRTEPSASKLVMLAQATNQPLDWFAEGLIADGARPKGLEPLTFWLGASTWTADDDAALREFIDSTAVR